MTGQRYGWMRGEGSPPAYLALLGLELSRAGDGEALVLWRPPLVLLNSAGIVQGGFIAAALDLASAAAAATVQEPAARSASVRLAIEYHRPVRATELSLLVRGEVVQSSRNWITADATVTDPDGTMLARAQHLISIRPGGTSPPPHR